MSRDAHNPADLRPGVTISGRYTIERELGRGGIGVVYLARDRQLHSKPVVLKILLETVRDNEWLRRKFHQEIEALARVDHPGIVGVLDAGELGGGNSFFVMQYVEGEPLRKLLRPGGMEIARTSALVSQLARALSAAHTRGIFHRDLKPENVMVQQLGDGDEVVKIIDFGIAHIKDSVVAPDAATKMAVGTVLYMAPEQLAAQPVSAATDVYALGVLAFEMLTGRHPFVPDTMFQLLELQKKGLERWPSAMRQGLSPAVDEVIARSLAFDPASRYQSAREFATDLDRALSSPGATVPISPDVSTPLEAGGTQVVGTPMPDTIEPRNAVTSRNNAGRTIPATQAAATAQPEMPPTTDAPPSVAPPERAEPSPRETPARPRAVWALVAFLVAAMLGVGWLLLRPTPTVVDRPDSPAPSTPPAATRELRYSVTVQKMRDGREYDEPFQATGQEIFEGGYQFWMNFRGDAPGYLYVVNEGPVPRDGMTSYNILYPTFGGSAEVAGGTTVSIPPRDGPGFTFDEEEGTEKMWLVWAKAPVPELEAVKRFANPNDRGVITGPAEIGALGRFLKERGADKPQITEDAAGEETIARGTGDTLVVLQPLKHR